MKVLKENPRNYGYIYETDKFIIDYYDIFFASYNTRIVKAEKTVTSKITKKKTDWRAWFCLPEELADALKVDDLLNNWPPKDPELNTRFDEWLEEKLLSEDEWIDDSIEEYSSDSYSEQMVSFVLLKNIDKALSYNAGLPETIQDFLKEATRVLKKEDYEFEYLEVYSELIKDENGNNKREFIIEGNEIVRISNTSKIELFNRLSRQGWILEFKDNDGCYIFKRHFEKSMPTFWGQPQQSKGFYYNISLDLKFSDLYLNDSTIKCLKEIGIIKVKDLLDTFNSIDELDEHLKSSIARNQDIDIYKNVDKREIEADISRLKNIFQQDKGISLQEAVFKGFLTPIEVLELSVRGYNCLKRARVYIVADLIEYSSEELLEIKNMSQEAASIIVKNLDKYVGLHLAS